MSPFYSQESDEKSASAVENSNKLCGEDVSRTGTDALIEMGVKTGLSLIFSILKQNWVMQASRCIDVIVCTVLVQSYIGCVWGGSEIIDQGC